MRTDGPTLGANVNLTRALSATSLDLPDLEHPRVDLWIQKFTTTMRGSYATYLERMPRYEKMISGKLADRGMPQDLIYLAMIESGFNPTAKSPVAARGLWQFMTPTAREYGLRIGRGVDDRTNPDRSTDAALTYLTKLHARFGSWYLAAAAYNTGQGRVARIMKEETGSIKGTDADYYRIANRLPQETRDYVPKMIAAAKIGRDPAKYGFKSS
ncbi:MAG: lytic transglycosylase domain-containing protein [Gemmatimonadaceae bacterium]